MNIPDNLWDLPKPHWVVWDASENEADGYGHINNSEYLKWLDRCVWDHCNAVEMPPERARELNRGMAVVKHEIHYIRSAYPGDQLVVANWVTRNDGRLRAERKFQIIRLSDQQTLLRAESHYICTNLETGKPARMPTELSSAFPVLPEVSALIDMD